jgi:hypothetical protein
VRIAITHCPERFATTSELQVSVTRDAGSLVLRYTRAFDDSFSGTEPVAMLVAYLDSSPAISYHGPGNREPFMLSLAPDAAAPAPASERGIQDPELGGDDSSPSSGSRLAVLPVAWALACALAAFGLILS